MALLERSRWYDMARSTNWTPTYVQEEDIFPPDMSDVFGLGMDVWDQYDEPYKVSFRDYVRVQREKDTAAYAVKEALSRSDYYDKAEPGWMTGGLSSSAPSGSSSPWLGFWGWPWH